MDIAAQRSIRRRLGRRRPHPNSRSQTRIAIASVLGYYLYFSPSSLAFIPSFIHLQKQYTSPRTHLSIATARHSDPSEPDLYQVLGVEPTATRSELKARYIHLARQFHPDATVSSDDDHDDVDDASDRFNEISTAYQLLRDSSQRRVYDRSLAAAQWSETIATAASEASVKAFEEFALPLLRRTTATTVAGLTAAAAARTQTTTDTKSTSSWWRTAVSAVSAASQSMDCMELLEQAERLEDRAVQRYQAAVDVQAQVTEAAQQRLHMAVTTPESGLTATEAHLWLEQQKLHEPHDPVIVHEIQPAMEELQHSEQLLSAQQEADATIHSTLHASREEQHTAQADLSECQRKEDAAWAAYEQAKQASFAAHHRFTAAANAVFRAERAAHESRHELLPPLQAQQTEQSERLRRAIVERLLEQQQQSSMNDTTAIEDENTELSQHQQRRLELQELRQQEQKLHADASAIEVEAAKLLAESSKLKRRAELLEARRSSRDAEDDPLEKEP